MYVIRQTEVSHLGIERTVDCGPPLHTEAAALAAAEHYHAATCSLPDPPANVDTRVFGPDWRVVLRLEWPEREQAAVVNVNWRRPGEVAA